VSKFYIAGANTWTIGSVRWLTAHYI